MIRVVYYIDAMCGRYAGESWGFVVSLVHRGVMGDVYARKPLSYLLRFALVSLRFVTERLMTLYVHYETFLSRRAAPMFQAARKAS